MSGPLKLVVETPIFEGLESVLIEEKNAKGQSTMYLQGPFMMANEVNRNNRLYPLEEMKKETSRYVKEMVDQKRAMGELNHPTSADINLERACHLVEELQLRDNYFIGKSKVLNTPMGLLVKQLVLDGVKLGMSSRALGKLTSEKGHDIVSELKIVAIDCVADPSCPTAFVNGILESKSYILNKDGSYEEAYERFRKGIDTLPKKDVNEYLQAKIQDFINQLAKNSR